jgi:hypothetical protein
MADSIEFDDRNLQQLFAEMEPKRRLQALRGGFRREANQIRKTAINNLRSNAGENGKTLRTDKDLEKGIRAVVFKRSAGFRVTIGTTKGNKQAGYHTNRRGEKKPILIWAEEGTKERASKPKRGTRRRADRKREQHRTGRMPRYGFMRQTLSDVEGTVTQDLHAMVLDNVEKIAKKYGCK